jgi:hypothetical protein
MHFLAGTSGIQATNADQPVLNAAHGHRPRAKAASHGAIRMRLPRGQKRRNTHDVYTEDTLIGTLDNGGYARVPLLSPQGI